MEQRQGSPENIEIKVVNPRRVDNVVHPACPTPARPRRKLSDYGPFKKWSSWLVPLFVAANVVLFVIVMFMNNCPKNSEQCIGRFLGRFAFQPFKENPLIGPSIATLKKMGALDVKRIVHGRHQGWRLLSCMWLHAGVFHILANMMSLVFIGIRLEQEFGFVRIGLLYVLSGFGGSLLSALFQDNGISVGASGALFGLLGSMLSELIANWTMYANKFAALLTLLFIILVNLAVGLLPHVDSFAHIGGFFTGFLIGFVLLIRPQFKWISQSNATPGHVTTSVTSKHKKYQYALWVISLILFIVAITLGMVSLLRGVNLNEHCSWCHYMNCIPSAKWKCQPRQFECLTSQHGNQLNLTCTNTRRTGTFTIPDISTYNIQQLCTELCD